MACKSIWDIDDEENKELHQYCSAYDSFKAMKLDSNLIKRLDHQSFFTPKRVQTKVIEHFSYKTDADLIVYAPCKSGKTSAIIIAVVNKLLSTKTVGRGLHAIMICPTYDLSKNAYDLAERLTRDCRPSIKFSLAVKGSQKKCDLRNIDFLIGTAEKVYDLVNIETNLSGSKKIKYFILDDANAIISEKFKNKFPLMFRNFLSDHCCSVFSSSLKTKYLDTFFDKFYPRAKMIVIPLEKSAVQFIKQIYVICNSDEEKIHCLMCMKSKNAYSGQTVIICQAKDVITKIAESFKQQNLNISILSGALSFTHRNLVLEQFKKQEIEVLLMTPSFMNVISFEFVSKLVNFDQILDQATYDLDLNTYTERASLFMGKRGLIINMIEKIWSKFLFQTSKSINGKSYFKGGEITDYENFKTYFDTLK